MLPPQANAEFVCAMENALEVNARPYVERRPVVCSDEASRQLLADVRKPLPAACGAAARIDYEYERRGTANLFMAFEPLAGKRRGAGASCRPRA